MSTLDRKSDHDARRAARGEAAAWVVRLHGPQRSPQLEEGFRRWLAAEPEHARQFERVTDIWDASTRVATSGLPRVRTRWRGSPVRAWAAAVSLAVAALAILFFFSGLFRSGVEYRTGIGAPRVVQLRDGSRVSLDADTVVRVAYGETERRVRLESGRAYFQVRHNPSWPFVVVAGRHQITDIGTAFMVRHRSGRTAVTLLEGRVAVSSRSRESGGSARISAAGAPGLAAGGPTQAIVLTAGQRLTFAAGPPQLDRPRLDDVTAWVRREIVLNDTPLPRVVADLNRYDPMRLVIADPQVARLHVSGIYHTGNNREFAILLAKLYGIQFAERGEHITLSSGETASR